MPKSNKVMNYLLILKWVLDLYNLCKKLLDDWGARGVGKNAGPTQTVIHHSLDQYLTLTPALLISL